MTAIIFDQLDGTIILSSVEEDWTMFDNLYVNMSYDDEEKNQLTVDLCSKLYGDDGVLRLRSLSRSEFAEVVRQGAEVIVCGFLP